MAIDFVGAGASFAFGLAALRKAGKLVCVGLFGGSAVVVPAMLSMKAVSVIGSYVGSLAEMRELMDIARAARCRSCRCARSRSTPRPQALDDLRAGRVRGRVILQP